MASLIEDFEDTNYVTTINFGDWSRVTNESHTGSASMRSLSPAADGGLYTARVTIPDGATAIRFWYKVSSETSDVFQFFLGSSGGSPVIQEGGTVAWKRSAEIALGGATVVRFVYDKDGSQGLGSDCAWVDDIEFIFPTTVNGWGPLPAF